MFTKIQIDAYRGLENITLNGLAGANLLVGDNNCGKTSVLEAIQLLGRLDAPDNVIRIARKRENPIPGQELMPFDLFEYSFPMDLEFRNICVQGFGDEPKYNCAVRLDMLYGFKDYVREEYADKICSSRRRKPRDGERIRFAKCNWSYFGVQNTGGNFYIDELLVRPEYTGDVPDSEAAGIDIHYVSPIEAYTDICISQSLYQGMLSRERQSLLDLLRIFDPDIMGIDVSYRYSEPMTLIEVCGERLVPISIYGDGLKKVLAFASILMKCRGGLLLIDEFDTSMHPGIMGKVADWLLRAAEMYHVQLFITTHSKEAVDAIVDVAAKKTSVMLYRLDHFENQIYVRKFNGEQLQNWSVEGGASVL